MASTYSSNLKLELIGTGDQSGTWGNTTNTNLGTLLEQAIVGYTTQAITDGADTTITIADGASSVARNYTLVLTGALTANRNLIVPAIQKSYIIYNNTSGGFSVTVKVSGQTGVTVANGKKAIVYNNGTDIVEVVNAAVTETGTQTLTNKTLTTPVLSGTASGTTAGRLGYLSGALSYGDGSAQRTVVNTDEAQTLTNKTLTTPVLSGTASGTTAGRLGYLSGALSYGTGSVQRTVVNTDEAQTLTNKTMSTSSVWNGNTVGVAYGGTGAATLTANNVILGNGTSAVQFVAPGTSGNVLTSNGTTWTSSAGGAPTPNVQTFNSSGTWTKPSGNYTSYSVEIWSGGGSGGKGAATAPGNGGGGGGYWELVGPISDLAATVTATVGAGGAAQTTANTVGNKGGNSSFTINSVVYTVYGGNPGMPLYQGGTGGSWTVASTFVVTTGEFSSNFQSPVAGDAGTGGAYGSSTVAGTDGGAGGYGGGGGGGATASATLTAGNGGTSGYGGGGGGAGGVDSAPGAGVGGTSRYGGAGGAGAFDANNATAGSAPGGGGGGSETGTSGAGGNGRIVVTVW